MTKYLPLALFVILAMGLILGCGGGGGGGGNNGGGNNGSYSPIRAEVVDSSGRFVDPANLMPNSTYTLQIIGFDSTSGIHVLSGASWSTTAPASVATVSAAGTLTTQNAGSATYLLSGTYGGATYTQPLGVWNNLATVTGRLRTLGGAAVGGAVVEFYNSGGQLVGSTRSNVNGSFIGNVPTTAKTFSVNFIDLVGFYDIFSYNGGDFSHGVAGCRANLPTLAANTTTSLVADVVLQKQSGGPPPPPPGCFTS